jgi:glycosyltransferase involved in cell wall biosynthesis
LISFIIPIFNDIRFLKQTIDSIVSQTEKDWEIVLVNDSTDQTVESDVLSLMNNYSLKHRFDYYKTHDIGLSRTYNYGINKSKGFYYVPLNPDDWIAPEFLEKLVFNLSSQGGFGFAYANAIYTDGVGYQRVPSPDYSFFQLIIHNYIVYASLFKRSVFDNVGGYDENNFNYMEDYQHYLFLGAHGVYGAHVNDDLFYYRVRKDSISQSDRTKRLESIYKYFFINQMPEIFPLEWQVEAIKTIADYPNDFLKWKPDQHVRYLEEKKL